MERSEYSEASSFDMACSSVNVAAPIRKRRFSSAKIQPTRVKKVMQSDEEIGRMVASVPVAVGRAMEHFAEKLLEASAASLHCSSSRTLSPAHMRDAVMRHRHFMFLEPVVREITSVNRVGSEFQTESSQAIFVSAPAIMQFTSVATDLYGANANDRLNMDVPSVPSANGFAATAKRKHVNASMTSAEVAKPKRGRPRKIKKEKSEDEEQILEESGARSESTSLNESNSQKEISDSELMPPPSNLPSRLEALRDENVAIRSYSLRNDSVVSSSLVPSISIASYNSTKSQ